MNQTSTILFALASALAWGTGDFSGGLVSKRVHPISVTLISNPVGLLCLIGFALSRGAAAPSIHDALFGLLAGMFGAAGLLAFYHALSTGKMGVVAPISAVIANFISVLFGALTEGAPSVVQLFGFVMGIVGVWVVSKPETGTRVLWSDLLPALFAGSAFGIFFILTAQFSAPDVSWALVAARFGTTFITVAMALLTRHHFRLERQNFPLVFIAGGLDSLGNLFFALATQVGRLDISAALSSLYPVTTVLLAMVVLRERLSMVQGIGAMIALLSIPLIVS